MVSTEDNQKTNTYLSKIVLGTPIDTQQDAWWRPNSLWQMILSSLAIRRVTFTLLAMAACRLPGGLASGLASGLADGPNAIPQPDVDAVIPPPEVGAGGPPHGQCGGCCMGPSGAPGIPGAHGMHGGRGTDGVRGEKGEQGGKGDTGEGEKGSNGRLYA